MTAQMDGSHVAGGRRSEVQGLNPAVLLWARERTGQTRDDVAQRLKKDPQVIEDWESGVSAPTYPELERLAYEVLKRPVAVFFFPAPPPEPTPEESFRTLPGFEVENLAPSTRLRIRRARADQLALAELLGDRSPVPRPIVSRIRVGAGENVESVAGRVRQELGVSLQTQVEEWRGSKQAFEAWRGALESVGVFVFKDAFKQAPISGFSLYDRAYPVIVVNNGTSWNRQTFTLFHELGHLLAHTGGITKGDEAFVRSLKGESREVEVFCNRFAAEALVPIGDFRMRSRGLPVTDVAVQGLAAAYKVSRETVLRRFLDEGRATRDHYERKAKEWEADYRRSTAGESGGNYYATQTSYLSPTYLREVFSRYLRGVIGPEEAASFLGVKSKNLPGFEEVVLQKAGTR